jgi:hypothetical protein
MEPASTNLEQARRLRELEAEITELCGHLNAAQHRWLVLIAEFDRRNGWSDGATQSCAHWLNWQCGIDLGAAREKVRVASPHTEDYLLQIAVHGTAAHVEKLVRQFRRAEEAEALSRDARQRAGRRLTYFYGEDGSLILKGRLSAEIGAQLIKALDAAVEATTADPEEERPSWGAQRADALGQIAESFLKHGLQVLAPAERQQIIVHVGAWPAMPAPCISLRMSRVNR